MECKNEIRPIDLEQFLPEVIRFRQSGWRMGQICAVRTPGGYELSYTFVKDYDICTLRLSIGEETVVSSITPIYPCAFIQENEMAELFGVRVENLSHDYHHRLYRIERDTPFKEKG